MEQLNVSIRSCVREPWNKGKLVGQKAPLRLKEIWAIRVRLQLAKRARELALFNLAVDSKLRSCDLVKLKVRDVMHGERVAARAIVMQRRRSDRSNSRLPSKPEKRWGIGFVAENSEAMISCSQAGLTGRPIYPPVNTRGSSRAGYEKSDWIPPRMVRTPCAGQKPR